VTVTICRWHRCKVRDAPRAARQAHDPQFSAAHGLVERAILVDAIKVPDTSDTSDKNLTYQPKPAWIKACTPDTSDTSKNTNSREVFLNWRLASLARTEALAMIWAAWPAASQAGAGRQTGKAVGEMGHFSFCWYLCWYFSNFNTKNLVSMRVIARFVIPVGAPHA